MNFDDVTQWLEGYKTAWETQNPEAIADLFCEDGEYFDSPFSVQKGHEGIVKYWNIIAAVPKDISFKYEIWHHYDERTLVHWTTNMIKKDVPRTLDGIFHLNFFEGKCKTLREWWHSSANIPSPEINS